MSSKTITIKVDLSCCDNCVQQIKKILRKFKGVESSSIDVRNGLVTVSGHIDHPEEIIENIKKNGKHVTMFSVHCDDDGVSELETNTDTKENHEPENSTEESDKGRHKSSYQSKFNGYGSEYFYPECACFYCSEKWEGIRVQQCHCCHCFHEQPHAQNHTRVNFDDEVSKSTPNLQPENGKRDSWEFNGSRWAADHKKCGAHGGQNSQSKVHGCGSGRFCFRTFKEWEGISGQHCCCCRGGEKFHAHEPIRVYFGDMPYFNPNHDYGHMHFADDMHEPFVTKSMPSQRTPNSTGKKDSGEFNGTKKVDDRTNCGAHYGQDDQSKGHRGRNDSFYDGNIQGDGIRVQQCRCREKFHAHEPEMVHFAGMHTFNKKQDSDRKPKKKVHFAEMPTYYYYPKHDLD